jgi:uncharacterized Zn-finger protein
MEFKSRMPAKCGECGKTLSCSGSLRSHMRTHTDDRPFWCSECPSKFRESSQLTVHHRYKHAPETSPHKCVPCDRTFATSTALAWHVRSGRHLAVCTHCVSDRENMVPNSGILKKDEVAAQNVP